MVTHQQIEKKLVDFYLKTTGNYGHSLMTSIDVTPETLVIALEGINEPITAFEYLIREEEKRSFLHYLSGHYKIWGNSSKFRYIVYLCYIASKEGIDSENFQKKLQENLKLGNRTQIQVNGVNTLFNELERLCNGKESYRDVKLPKNISASMKHIGIIYEFTFPNWRLESLLNKNLYRNEHTPETLSKELQKNISEFKQHVGLYQAITVFIQRVILKNKFLEEDPFWSFYLRWNRPKVYKKEKIYFYLENELESSYFDLGNSRVNISELNENNSNFFVLKREKKSFYNKVFFFKELHGKYELKENIQRFEDIDAVLFHIEKYGYEGLCCTKI